MFEKTWRKQIATRVDDGRGPARGRFAGRRIDDHGHERPDSVLNRTPFRSAEVLLAGPTVDRGSIREAAVRALAHFTADLEAGIGLEAGRSRRQV